jgi:hypothetical protein
MYVVLKTVYILLGRKPKIRTTQNCFAADIWADNLATVCLAPNYSQE